MGQLFLRFLAWRRMEDQWIGRVIQPQEVTWCIVKTSVPLLLLPLLPTDPSCYIRAIDTSTSEFIDFNFNSGFMDWGSFQDK